VLGGVYRAPNRVTGGSPVEIASPSGDLRGIFAPRQEEGARRLLAQIAQRNQPAYIRVVRGSTGDLDLLARLVYDTCRPPGVWVMEDDGSATLYTGDGVNRDDQMPSAQPFGNQGLLHG